MAGRHTRLVFKSALLRVIDYRCEGHDTLHEEEWPLQHEIVLPRHGAYQRRDRHGAFLADPNQVLFFNPGEPYEIRHPLQGSDASTVFVLAPETLNEIAADYSPAAAENPLRLFPTSHLHIDSRLQALQFWLLRPGSSAADILWLEEQLLMRLGDLVAALYRSTAAPRSNSPGRPLHERIAYAEAVKAFLNAHLQERVTLEQISAAVHLSPFHLCRVFRQVSGVTIHQYGRQLRLYNAAEQILKAGAGRLDAIALDYGFSNHAHFSTTFRQAFGFSPSELRSASLRVMSKILEA